MPYRIEMLGETWVGSVDAIRAMHDGFAFGKKPGNAERHRDAVVAV
jgi:hypothetical protein